MGRRFLPLAAALVAAVLAAPDSAGAADADAQEYVVKAAYIAKLGDYVDWPASALPAAGSFVICIAGNDPFGPALETSVAGQKIAGHPVTVRRLGQVARDAPCQMLFVGGSEPSRIAEIIASVRGAPMLTLTDDAGEAGGIVNFVVKDRRVRFTIDDQAAAQNGLKVSSKLLALALSVKPRQ